MQDRLMTFLDYALISDDEVALDLLKGYFDEDQKLDLHLKEYEDELNGDEIKAIACLFDREKSLDQRAYEALKYDEWCLEAILINSHYLDKNTNRDDYYYSYFQKVSNSLKLSVRASYSAKIILAVYSAYLLFTFDMEGSLEVQKTLIKLGAINTVTLSQLLVTYGLLNRKEETFEVLEDYFEYLDNELGISVIVDVLLKMHEKPRAKEFYEAYIKRHGQRVETCEELLNGDPLKTKAKEEVFH